MLRKNVLRSCCGGKAYIFQTQKPILKEHVEAFEKAGFEIPAAYKRAGLFYVQKKGLVATAAFGANKIQVRVNKRTENVVLPEFEKVLDELTHA